MQIRSHMWTRSRNAAFWAKAHLKWSEVKWKTVLWSDESKYEILCGNQVLQTKEERNHPTCSRQTLLKPACLMVWGCIRVYDVGSLHIWHNQCWRVYRGFRATYTPIKTTSLSGKALHISERWRRVLVLNWPFNNKKHLKWAICQQRPGMVEWLWSCIRQEWDDISLLKLQQQSLNEALMLHR